MAEAGTPVIDAVELPPEQYEHALALAGQIRDLMHAALPEAFRHVSLGDIRIGGLKLLKGAD